jgi:hypothetical protein
MQCRTGDASSRYERVDWTPRAAFESAPTVRRNSPARTATLVDTSAPDESSGIAHRGLARSGSSRSLPTPTPRPAVRAPTRPRNAGSPASSSRSSPLPRRPVACGRVPLCEIEARIDAAIRAERDRLVKLIHGLVESIENAPLVLPLRACVRRASRSSHRRVPEGRPRHLGARGISGASRSRRRMRFAASS